MREDNRILRVLSMLGGLGLIGVGAFLNVTHAAEIEKSYTSPVCVAIAALAFGSALAMPIMCAAWHGGRKALAVATLIGLVAGESYGFVLTAERLLASREARTVATVDHNSPWLRAKEALDEAISDKEAECASGRGPRCALLQGRVDARRAELAKAPSLKSESLIASTTGLPAAVFEIIPALAFSVALLTLGLVFMGFAHGSGPDGGERVDPESLRAAAGETEQVVDWVRRFRIKHGRDPQIPEVQQRFPLPKTTAWRRIKSA